VSARADTAHELRAMAGRLDEEARRTRQRADDGAHLALIELDLATAERLRALALGARVAADAIDEALARAFSTSTPRRASARRGR
jgi:hypothetical protein